MVADAAGNDQHRSGRENLLSAGQCTKQRLMDIHQNPLTCGPIHIRSSDRSPSHGDESLCAFSGHQTPTQASQRGEKDSIDKDGRCQEVGAVEVDVEMVDSIVAVEERNENRCKK